MAQKNKAQIVVDLTTAQNEVDLIVTNTTQSITGDVINSILDKLVALLETLKDSTVVRNDDIIDTLLSSVTDKPLSANQGRVLKALIDALSTVATSGDYNDLINKPVASETLAGVIEIATAAEANALTDTTRAVVPSKLPISSETQRGLIEIATTAEVNAGLSNALAVTPAGLQASTLISGKANVSHTHTASNITDFNTAVSANTDVANSTAVTDLITITGGVNLDNVPEGDATWKTLVEGFVEQSAISPASLTTLTQAGSFTPDYAIQAMTSSTPFGFVSANEAETVLSVILNLQARVNQLEIKLQANNLIA